MTRVISTEDLKGLFTKPYGTDAPTKQKWAEFYNENVIFTCLLYTSPSPRDLYRSRMPSSA